MQSSSHVFKASAMCLQNPKQCLGIRKSGPASGQEGSCLPGRESNHYKLGSDSNSSELLNALVPKQTSKERVENRSRPFEPVLNRFRYVSCRRMSGFCVCKCESIK